MTGSAVQDSSRAAAELLRQHARIAEPANGLATVPEVPTNAMTSAGANAVEDPENERSSWDLAENVWRAMVEAAPALTQVAAIAAGVAYAAPERVVSTQEICDRFAFLEGAVTETCYWRIVNVADSIQTEALRVASHGQAPARPDPAYSEACNLATALFKKHFAHLPDFASGQAVWGLCDSTAGVISQIDNMVSGLVQPPASGGWISVDERLPPSARPVLACNPRGFIGRAEFSSGRWNHIGKPSHWMPLPPLPASPAIEGDSNV